MTRGFKIFALLLLTFLCFWAYQLREKDLSLLLRAVRHPPGLALPDETGFRRAALPPTASAVDSIQVRWSAPPPPALPPVRVEEESGDPAGASGPGEARPPEPRSLTPPRGSDTSRVLAPDPSPPPRGERRLLDPAPPGVRTIEHEVREGENLWQIARRLLGSGAKYHRILEWNALSGDEPLLAGTRLRIRISGVPGPPPGSSSPARPRHHEVKEGETLAKLARRYYSDGEAWRAIFEANRSILRNPHALRVGITLTIPQPRM